MARQAKAPAHGLLREYVPAALGNRDAPAADKVRVWIRNPTEGEKREIHAGDRAMRVGRDGVDGLQFSMRDAIRQQAECLSRFVTKVDNYVDSAGGQILDGASLATHGESEIVVEIFDEIMLGLSLKGEQGKQSAESHDSCSVGTRLSESTVPTAGEMATTSTGHAVVVYKDSST